MAADITREQEAREREADRKLALIGGEKCDKYDYLIAVACGAAAGLIDIFFVGCPKDSELAGWTDQQVDKAVMAFAKRMGWSSTYTNGPNAGQPRGVNSAIGWLEKEYKVNYDQRHSTDVGNLFSMSTKNHHLMSLSHAPDAVGLFFSILDQFQGKSSFIANGEIIRIEADNGDFTLRGGNFIAKVYCGFCNWLGHLMSDVAGSSGSRGRDGRGSGIEMPFYELFQLFDFGSFQIGKDRQSFAMLMKRAFQEGYDLRFGLTAAIPVVLQGLFIRVIWALRQHFDRKHPWHECIPDDSHANLRFMLIMGNATLCLFDGVDAAARSGGNALVFVLHLNIVAWCRLVRLAFKEICIQFDFSYADMAVLYQRADRMVEEYLERLRRIDYPAYQQELAQMHDFDAILADDGRDTTPIYAYLEAHGADLQFHNFEEFNEKMLDPDFVLEI